MVTPHRRSRPRQGYRLRDVMNLIIDGRRKAVTEVILPVQFKYD